MSKTPNAPENITVEFLHANGEHIRLGDLGSDFLSSLGLGLGDGVRPFRVAIERRESKAGNAYYEYSQNGVPFPDGLSTYVRVEGAIVPLGRVHPSNNGYPTRDGGTEVIVGGVVYKVTVYLTESKTPYFVKVVAHKKPEGGLNSLKAQRAPRGGSII
jgi:hypothetical protein